MKNFINKIKDSIFFQSYLDYTKFWFKISLLPTLYIGYFFNLNAATLGFYGSLVFFSMLNSHSYFWFFIFIFLLDIPITYGILAILMKNEKTRPSVYAVLGEDNVKFFLGNPGQAATRLATRVGGVVIGVVVGGVFAGGIQDQLNMHSADRYADFCKKNNIPINPTHVETILNRSLPILVEVKDFFKKP